VIPDLVVEQPAKADLADAVDWYKSMRPGLDQDFLLCTEEALALISHYPVSSPILFRNLRRRLLRRFPYGVFYLHEPSLIRVLGVLHTSRDPRLIATRGH
jgi:toxin ParE1/3/4